jgi:hypothetical protein
MAHSLQASWLLPLASPCRSARQRSTHVTCVAVPQSSVTLERPAPTSVSQPDVTTPRTSTAPSLGRQADEIDWETFIRSELFRTFQFGVWRSKGAISCLQSLVM